MAEWKKVIVSGSAAELSSLSLSTDLSVANGGTGASTFSTGQLLTGNGTSAVTTTAVNGTGNIAATTGASGLSHSGSFSGSFQGNGAGLTGVTATAVFPATNLTPITAATQLFASDGANKYVTVGQVSASVYGGVSGDITISAAGVASIAADSVALGTDTTGNYVATIDAGGGLTGGATTGEGVAHTLAVGAGTHITVNANDVAVNTTTLAPAISGSLYGGVSGDITINAAGVAAIGSGVIVNADIAAGAAIAVSKLAASTISGITLGSNLADLTIGSGLVSSTAYNGSTARTAAVGAGTHITVNTNDVAVNTSTLIPAISGSIFGQVSGDVLINGAGVATIQANAVAISTDVSGLGTGVATFLGTPSSANLAAAITDETGTGTLVFSASPTFTGTLNAAAVSTSGNVTVGGNLTVTGLITGSATYINSTNVAITDQFILLASGSGATVDAGIIVQDAAGDGEAFYWENNTTGTSRWAIASSVAPSAVTVTAAEYMVSARTAAGAPSGAPTYGGATNGFGQIYVNSSNSDIYIYA